MDDVRADLKSVVARAHQLGILVGRSNARNEAAQDTLIAWILGALTGVAAGWLL